jgi:hypothetical protein
VQPPAGHHHRAQGEGHVHVAPDRHVAEGAGVGAAAHRLELVDDLHRAHLGGARGRAHRQRGGEGVERRAAVGELALDARHQVHDVRVALDAHEVGDLDAAGAADAAQVVAAEVDEHDVLGALLGVGGELDGERVVLGRRGATAAGAGDRARLDAAALGAHQALGAAGHQRDGPEVEVAEVGARVDRAQRAVDGERVHAQVGRQPLARDHLEHVAGVDVRDGLGDGVAEGLRREVAGELDALPRPIARHARQRPAQARVGGVDEGLRPRAVVGVAGDRRRHDVRLAAQVVEHEEHLGLDEAEVGHAELVGVRVREALVEAHEVVGGVPDRAAPEGGQVGVALRGPHRTVPQHAQRVARHDRLAAPPLRDGQPLAAGLEAAPRAGADERVARHPLPLLDGLEQERRGTGDLEVGRQGRLEVGQDLAEHGLEADGHGAQYLSRRASGMNIPIAWKPAST